MKGIVMAIALSSLAGCTPAFAGNEFSVGAGKMLNNTNTEVPGWVGSIEYAHTKMLWDLSVRVDLLKASRSHLSEWGDSTFETIAVAKDVGPWTFGLGEVEYMNYDAHCKWKGRLYAHDLHNFSRHCWQCGQVATVAYHFQGRFSVEAQYYRVMRFSPTYNGTILLLKYDIYRSE